MKKDRHAKVEVNCENCGEPFLARRERVEQGLGRFCSKACFDVVQRNTAMKTWGRKDLARFYKIGNRYTARWYDENGDVVSVSYGRWWWEMNVGEIPDGMTILPKDNNALNIDPSNFYLGTRSDALVRANETRKKDPAYWDGYIEKLRQKQIGFKHTPKSKAKISAAHKGKTLSTEQKNKISDSMIERWKNGEFNYQKKEGNRFWKNNKTKHPKEFNKALKGFVRERDGEVCQICGRDSSGKKGVVHHIDGVKSNNDLDNLILLCASCHMRVHFTTENTSPVIMAFREKLLE
jgi:hypothetical protein